MENCYSVSTEEQKQCFEKWFELQSKLVSVLKKNNGEERKGDSTLDTGPDYCAAQIGLGQTTPLRVRMNTCDGLGSQAHSSVVCAFVLERSAWPRHG